MDLRNVMREYPTGVTIVTAASDGEWFGGTMNSFTSVSLDPPLIAVFIGTKSRTAQAILKSKAFAVNILSGDQEDLAGKFARDSVDDKFKGVQVKTGRNDVPLITDSLAVLQCDLYMREEIADHVMIVGEVRESSLNGAPDALLYCDRNFQKLKLNRE